MDRENCFWEQVLWHDERKTKVFGHDVEKIWHKKSDTFLPKNAVPTSKHGGSSMKFWSCFSLRGTGQLILIREIKKSEDYIKILDKNLQLSAQNLDLGWQFTFQQDDHPKYMSKSVTVWLQKKKIKVLSWPSMGPDLNPIENQWQKLKVWINH